MFAAVSRLFVAHGLLNPQEPDLAGRFAVLDSGAGVPGDAVQPDLSSDFDMAEFEETIAVAGVGAAGRCVQLLYPSAQMPMLEDMAGRFPE